MPLNTLYQIGKVNPLGPYLLRPLFEPSPRSQPSTEFGEEIEDRFLRSYLCKASVTISVT